MISNTIYFNDRKIEWWCTYEKQEMPIRKAAKLMEQKLMLIEQKVTGLKEEVNDLTKSLHYCAGGGECKLPYPEAKCDHPL